MVKKKKKKSNSLEEINQFGPFCHGTSSSARIEITNEGKITPRGEERGSRYYEEEELISLPDRVYFASIPKHVGSCLEAMETACADDFEILWLKGTFYVLEEIPEKFANRLRIDEDCKRYDKACKTPLRSLEVIGSLGIASDIPLEDVTEMTPKQFYKYIKGYYPTEIPQTWNEFITKRLENIGWDIELTKERYPDLFEEEEGEENERKDS